jgi:hypothetical protein
MNHFNRLWLVAAIAAGVTACDDDDDDIVDPGDERTFTVTIENVSTNNLLATTRVNGTVPLSPGVWAVFTGQNPLFAVGSAADEGTERIAEDGNEAIEAAAAFGAAVASHGTFSAPGGTNNSPIIGAGETATFTITAEPGDLLQIETMFAQSNDWFYAFGGEGLALFNGTTPITGDVTASLVLYDAGTEEDTAPGTGPDQATVQSTANTGPADDNTLIRLASLSAFTIPATTSVIRVTITPN